MSIKSTILNKIGCISQWQALLSWLTLIAALVASVMFYNNYQSLTNQSTSTAKQLTSNTMMTTPLWLMIGLLTTLVGAVFWLRVIKVNADHKPNNKALKTKYLSETNAFNQNGLHTSHSSNTTSELSAYYMAAMGEIDNAILSNADFDQITAQLFLHAFKIIPSSFIAITKLEKSNAGGPVTTLVFPNGTKQTITAKLDKSISTLLSTNQTGCLVDKPENYPFLNGLKQDNYTQFLVQPIYKDGGLFAILYFSLPKNTPVTLFERTCASAFANRLGVAKTASARHKESYTEAYFDNVTGLFNRHACRDRLSQEVSRARRQASKLATFYLNLDGFKKINDAAGYLVGDMLLKAVADRLKANMREADILACLGADEFVVIITDIDKVGQANIVADKIIKMIESPFTISNQVVNISVSIGISLYPNDGATADEILHHADSAMVSAKKVGRGQWAFYDANITANQIYVSQIEQDLRLAIANNELHVVYQPQISSRSGKVIGAEALIRWQHAERGMISPLDFIHIAEESGLIIALGKFVRKTVFTQYMEWAAKGIILPKISVNVSNDEIEHKDFISNLKALIAETGMPTDKIELEITESIFIDKGGYVFDSIKEISEMGISIAIDDFGMGFSNLSNLVRLPFNVLKVDKTFVQDIGVYPSTTRVANMIIEMAHNLGKTVCAEGIETEQQLQYLTDAGCECMQGFLLSKPLNPDQLIAFIKNNDFADFAKVA